MTTASSFPRAVLFPVFVLSGISALIYQLVWQRMLLMIYGSNVESVAMVVAAFLMGLGIGSLLGGWLSENRRIPLVLCFSVAELGVGVYGLGSVDLFQWVGGMTSDVGSAMTGVLAFALVFLPTLLMGATLPLLVAHQVKACGSVGESVSWLYFVNTLGAALGSFLAALWLLRICGLSGSVRVAASLNAVVAGVVFIVWLVRRKAV
jgi:predicted membrane-bound spermidine synthase